MDKVFLGGEGVFTYPSFNLLRCASVVTRGAVPLAEVGPLEILEGSSRSGCETQSFLSL